MRAQRDSHLSSELWRSAAARSPGRSHSCLDPRWWSPGSDSSGTSSPHPPWYNKTPMELTVLFGFLEVELLRVCNWDSWGIPEAPASIRCAIAVLPHGHHLSGSERPAKANWEGALDVQDGRCPLWIHTKPHLKTLYHFCIAWHKIQYVYQRYLKDRSCVSLLFISIIWSKISFVDTKCYFQLTWSFQIFLLSLETCPTVSPIKAINMLSSSTKVRMM